MVPHPPHGRPTENGPAPLLTLKVLLGGTRFPIRPVLKDRFTIGSGERCDLRLGGDLPPLHSVLLVTPTEVLLEQIASSPALIVNRVAQSSAVLHDGDRIRIGGVELEASLPAPSAVRFPPPLSGQVRETVTAEEQAEVDLTELSAEQLLDLFELEQTEIERDALGRNQGAEALLSEARRRQKREQINTVHAPSPTTVGPHWNMARIPLERLIEAAARRASGEAALQQKIDTLQLAVARLGQQIDSIVATQSTSAARNSNAISDTVTQLRRERTRLITELNALFQDDAPLASRTTA
jgi:hypothetical protein